MRTSRDSQPPGKMGTFPHFPRPHYPCYNFGVDVFIIPEARREIEALKAFQPKAGTWGALVGHRRGPRVIVEKVLAGGGPGTAPDAKALAALDGIWPGRIIGLIAVRPGSAFTRAALGPAWFGKVILTVTGPARSPILRPQIVEFERQFRFVALPLAAAGKEKAHE